MSRTFDDDFVAEFSAHFLGTVRYAARLGSPDPEGTAEEGWARTYEARTRCVEIRCYRAFVCTCIKRLIITGRRKQERHDRAVRMVFSRSDFALFRQLRPRSDEVTTGELIDLGSDPASPAEQRAVEHELATVGRWILETVDPQCPLCRVYGGNCPSGRRYTATKVRMVAAATIGRLLDTLIDTTNILTAEEALRAIAAEVFGWPHGANLEKAEATTWARGPALCCAFLIHRALMESNLGPLLGIDFEGAPALVSAVAKKARNRRPTTWTPQMERTMREWCDANRVDWPPQSVAA